MATPLQGVATPTPPPRLLTRGIADKWQEAALDGLPPASRRLLALAEDAFLFEDRRYASLTEVAHAITGAHWSGPRFFGLVRNGAIPNASQE